MRNIPAELGLSPFPLFRGAVGGNQLLSFLCCVYCFFSFFFFVASFCVWCPMLSLDLMNNSTVFDELEVSICGFDVRKCRFTGDANRS